MFLSDSYNKNAITSRKIQKTLQILGWGITKAAGEYKLLKTKPHWLYTLQTNIIIVLFFFSWLIVYYCKHKWALWVGYGGDDLNSGHICCMNHNHRSLSELIITNIWFLIYSMYFLKCMNVKLKFTLHKSIQFNSNI